MILGHLTIDNVIAVVSGVISIGVGIGVLRWRTGFERAAAQIQRGLGPLGARASSKPRPWATVAGAIGFIVLGALVVVLGLFFRLTH